MKRFGSKRLFLLPSPLSIHGTFRKISFLSSTSRFTRSLSPLFSHYTPLSTPERKERRWSSSDPVRKGEVIPVCDEDVTPWVVTSCSVSDDTHFGGQHILRSGVRGYRGFSPYGSVYPGNSSTEVLGRFGSNVPLQ